MQPKRYGAGLTLVELMIVVAVMAILATIAYPLYTAQAQKSRRADARTILLQIAQAEERYFSVNGNYAVSLQSLSIDSGLVGGCSGSSCNTERGYYTVTLSQPGGATTFQVAAAPVAGGPQATDACTQLTVNQLGVRSGSGTGCW